MLGLCARSSDEQLRETRYAQPAIFVTNVALAKAVGDVLDPVVSAGHSFGEYCSLTLASALTFETALSLVNQRGLAMQRATAHAQGAMAAVLGLDPDALRAAVAQAVTQGAGRVQLANFNAPGQIVISGDAEAVRVAGDLAMAAGAKRVVQLNVSGAWHSVLMDPAREEFARHVMDATVMLPRFTVISNVDAQPRFHQNERGFPSLPHLTGSGLGEAPAHRAGVRGRAGLRRRTRGSGLIGRGWLGRQEQRRQDRPGRRDAAGHQGADGEAAQERVGGGEPQRLPDDGWPRPPTLPAAA